MLNSNKVAVISSGNGGQSLAAYFSYKGCISTLYAREQERVDMFPSNSFELSGEIEGAVPIALISCDMRRVIENAHLIMVTTPSQYHHIVAENMAPYLEDGQIIMLNPGRTFGTHIFEHVLAQQGCHKRVIIAEAETFIFTCRCLSVGKPRIYKIKDHMKVAAHDPADTPQVVQAMQRFFPTVTGADSVLETGLGNMGLLFHPLPVLMNLTRIEKEERFLYYKEAISPLVAYMLERMDKERLAVADALHVATLPVMEWLNDKYGSTGSCLYDCLQNTDAYSDVYAPTALNTRYIFEDVPTGCVPLLCMGNKLGIDMPVTQGVIRWASAVYNKNFYEMGRNDRTLDLDAIIHQAGLN